MLFIKILLLTISKLLRDMKINIFLLLKDD